MLTHSIDGSGGIAVIAVTFQLSEDGSTTELLTAVTEKLSEIATPGTVTETGALDFTALIDHIQTTPLFQYTGSLTTPPCAEGLTFLVTKEPLPLNVATFNSIKSVIKFNSRFTQNTLGEANLLEVGAGNLGCAVEGGDKVEDVIASKTLAHEATTIEAPIASATTTAMAHPAPVTTTAEAAVSSPAATEHPIATPTLSTPQKSHIRPVVEEVDRSTPHDREYTRFPPH